MIPNLRDFTRCAAMLAFVARTPLKLVLVDRWRHRWLDRSRLALRIAAVEIALIVVLGAVLSSFTVAVLVEPGAAPLLLALSLAVQLIALLPSAPTVKAAFA